MYLTTTSTCQRSRVKHVQQTKEGQHGRQHGGNSQSSKWDYGNGYDSKWDDKDDKWDWKYSDGHNGSYDDKDDKWDWKYCDKWYSYGDPGRTSSYATGNL